MERAPGTGQTAVPGFFKLLASNPKRRSRSTASEPPGLPLKASPVSRRCPYHFISTVREFITLLGGAAVWPLAARAQQPTMPVVGFLRDATAAGSGFMVDGLRKGLAEAGFVKGRNLAIEYAWTDGRSERLSSLAADLVGPARLCHR